MFKKIDFIFTNEVRYIIINLFISAIGLVRAFFMLRELNLIELGLISILQTLIMLISFTQFGLINGAFRIYCQKNLINRDQINNTVHSYLLIICFLFVPILFMLNIFNFTEISYEILFFGLSIGLISLFNNWINNTFIALKKLPFLNRINFLASIISLIFALMIPFFGFYFAIISIISFPIFYFFYSYFKYPELRPKTISFDLTILKKILSYGFIPFMAGIFGLLNVQIEVWSITSYIGLESLGEYYLPILISSLFFLIPSSVNSLYFPDAVIFFTEGNKKLFYSLIKKYYLFIILYSFVVLLMIYFLFEPLVSLIFPIHTGSVNYVYIIIPGLILKLLAEPIWLIFNSAVVLRPIFLANFFSVIFTIVGIFLFYHSNIFDLTNLSIVKSFIGFQLLFFGVFSILYTKNRLYSLIDNYSKK